MSWEEMHRRDYPCSCGKGTYTEVVEMDDWKGRREHRTMHCFECAEKERIAKIEEAKEKSRLKKLDEEIKTYFAEHYMGEWLTYFASARNKKETWALAKEIGIERNSLSSFYNQNKALSTDEYIRRLARYDNIQEIMQVLDIEDSDLKCKVKEAMELKKSDYARLLAHWHNDH